MHPILCQSLMPARSPVDCLFKLPVCLPCMVFAQVQTCPLFPWPKYYKTCHFPGIKWRERGVSMEMILCLVIYVFLVSFLALEMQYYKIQNFFSSTAALLTFRWYNFLNNCTRINYSCILLSILNTLCKKEVALKIKQSLLLFNTMLTPAKEDLELKVSCENLATESCFQVLAKLWRCVLSPSPFLNTKNTELLLKIVVVLD